LVKNFRAIAKTHWLCGKKFEAKMMVDGKEYIPPRTQSLAKLVTCFILACIAAASMWSYVDWILVGHQVADAAAHQRPRGNLSDLYPRWLGARELLLHHRNPYSDEITLEIQQGYYGRALDSTRPDDPKDQQGFVYPVYVVFLLSPLIQFPFHNVQIFFYWLLIFLTAAGVCLWLRVLRWRLRFVSIATCIVLTLGSFPAVQGIKLQQLSLLAATMFAGSAACVASGFLLAGGALLALATIKPQLAWPLVAWLLFWAICNWRARRNLVYGFGAGMALLFGAAEIVLPGWLRMFAAAVGKYHRYTQNKSVLDELLPGAYTGKIAAIAAALACAWLLWKLRDKPVDEAGFGLAIALITALTVLIVPMYAPYNQVLLLPAILAIIRDRTSLLSHSRSIRFVYAAGVFALAWQWLASLSLIAIFFFLPTLALTAWKWPIFSTFAIPVLVFALIFMDVLRQPEVREPRK
jgi:Glycosyltransferase family 87